jgi:hypothetical protein
MDWEEAAKYPIRGTFAIGCAPADEQGGKNKKPRARLIADHWRLITLMITLCLIHKVRMFCESWISSNSQTKKRPDRLETNRAQMEMGR